MKKNYSILINKLDDLDFISLILVAILTIFGLLTIYSATMFNDTITLMGQPFIKQIFWLAISFFVFFFIYTLRKNFLQENGIIFYIFGIISIIIPFFQHGSSTQTNRWLDFGFFQMQTSEYMKFFLIIMLAKYFSETKMSKNQLRYVFLPLFLALLPTGIVFSQPDLGTSMVYLAIFGGMLFVSGARLYHIFLLTAPIITILAAFNITTFFIWGIIMGIIIFINHRNIFTMVFVFVLNVTVGLITPIAWNSLKPYQQQRILTLFNANLDPQGAGYQVIQSQIAIGSGGFRGKGYLSGTQTHLRFLPAQHTDFIFSVIAEEMGFATIIILFAVFLFLLIRWARMAYNVRDKFGSMLIVGASTAILFHIFINIGMTLGLMPVTGKPLPFISYGGSFLMTCYGLVALILNGNSEQLPQKHSYS